MVARADSDVVGAAPPHHMGRAIAQMDRVIAPDGMIGRLDPDQLAVRGHFNTACIAEHDQIAVHRFDVVAANASDHPSIAVGKLHLVIATNSRMGGRTTGIGSEHATVQCQLADIRDHNVRTALGGHCIISGPCDHPIYAVTLGRDLIV